MSFFCPQRGYMLTRSSNDKDAAFLSLHCRQDNGGHTSADRNNFVFAALGRLWGCQLNQAGGSSLGQVNESRFFSTILIDNQGQCGAKSGCFPVPGKVVEYVDSPDLTYMVGDAKYAYDWEWKWSNGDPKGDSPDLAAGWTKVEETPNDFQYKKQPYDFMDKTFYMKSHWIQPGMVQHYVKRPWNPVQKAFRTAGLVRGEHPYAVIVDDIRKDDKRHGYKWLMQTSRDLEVVSYEFDDKDESKPHSITLTGAPENSRFEGSKSLKRDQPMLKVVIARNENDTSKRRYASIARLEAYMSNPRWGGGAGKRLVVESYSVAPKFKILLLPYRYGQGEPNVQWLDGYKTRLSVTMDDQHDVIDFSLAEGGWTNLVLKRQASGNTK